MVRPRRALRPPLRMRIARVAIPTLAAGALVTGATSVLWPDSISAVPAPIAGPAAAAGAERTERPSRTQSDPRPALNRAPAGDSTADGVTQSEAATVATVEGKAPSESDPKAKKSSPKGAKTKKAPAKRAEQAKAATKEAKPEKTGSAEVIGRRYATEAVNVRTDPDADSSSVTVLEPASKIAVTATVRAGWRQVRHDGSVRWVKESYLTKSKPKVDEAEEGEGGGLSSAPCAGGSGVESGLTSDAIAVHRALCARFPQVSSYGGRRADSGNHGSGRAVDVMIGNSSVGWEIARYARANAKRLGVSEVIYSQKIWTVQRGGEGWRSMSDRGSTSANHYDHVHVSVYGNSGNG